MPQQSNDVVCQHVGIGIGSGAEVQCQLPPGRRNFSPEKQRRARDTYVFSMRLTIHVFRCGASSSGNSIVSTSTSWAGAQMCLAMDRLRPKGRGCGEEQKKTLSRKSEGVGQLLVIHCRTRTAAGASLSDVGEVAHLSAET